MLSTCAGVQIDDSAHIAYSRRILRHIKAVSEIKSEAHRPRNGQAVKILHLGALSNSRSFCRRSRRRQNSYQADEAGKHSFSLRIRLVLAFLLRQIYDLALFHPPMMDPKTHWIR